jgi:hypothetical protein
MAFPSHHAVVFSIYPLYKKRPCEKGRFLFKSSGSIFIFPTSENFLDLDQYPSNDLATLKSALVADITRGHTSAQTTDHQTTQKKIILRVVSACAKNAGQAAAIGPFLFGAKSA